MTIFFLNIKQDKKKRVIVTKKKFLYSGDTWEKWGRKKVQKKKDKAVRNWTASVQCLQFLGVSV